MWTNRWSVEGVDRVVEVVEAAVPGAAGAAVDEVVAGSVPGASRVVTGPASVAPPGPQAVTSAASTVTIITCRFTAGPRLSVAPSAWHSRVSPVSPGGKRKGTTR